MKLPNIANLAAWIFLPTVLVIAFYAVKATQINHFQLIINTDGQNQTVKNKFIDEFYLPNRHDKDIEFFETSFVTKSIITYFKSLHFLKKAGIEYTVKRLSNKEYKSIAAA
jgi:hypothetical protein